MMEAESTPETLVNFYQTTRRYNPEDSHLYTIYYSSLLLCSVIQRYSLVQSASVIRNKKDFKKTREDKSLRLVKEVEVHKGRKAGPKVGRDVT
jgi:hypothetical protein